MSRTGMLALAALMLLHGCAKYKYVSPYQEEEIEGASKIIVTTSPSSPDCCRHELTGATLGDRTLTGYDPADKKVVIALSSIQSIMTVHTQARAVWYVLAVAASAGAVVGSAVVLKRLHEEAAEAPPPPEGESCPFFYSFDGKGYVFEAEMYGGSITRGLERTEWCRLEHLVESNGRYLLRVTNELPETQHINEVALVVVDHPESTMVVPNIRGRIHTISKPVPPLSAYDGRGNDIRAALARRDGVFWRTGPAKRDPSNEEDLRDELILEFPKPAGAEKVKLLVNCSATDWAALVAREFLTPYGSGLADWYADVDRGGPELQKVLDWYYREELYVLQVHVQTSRGWETREVIFGGGPFASKDKVYVLDLSDVPGDRLKIKLRPPAYFWRLDHLAVDYSEDLPVFTTEIEAARAVDRPGNDVRRILAANDDAYLVMPKIGDSADLEFAAPPERPGMSRSVVLKAGGFYRIHIQSQGEPQADLIDRLNYQPGYTIRYALEKRRERCDRLGRARGKTP
jgi:hypothetical protein